VKMDLRLFFDKILEKCSEVLKDVWKPVYGSVPDRFAGTKFGGADPYRWKYFQWPYCLECGNQKEFICQINIKNLPENLQEHIQRKTGLFQCFLCLHDYCLLNHICYFDDIFFVPETELFPSLQSLAARFIFQNNISTNNLPEKLKTYVLKYNEVFQFRDDMTLHVEEKNIKEWIEAKRELPNYYEFKNSSKLNILTKINVSEEELYDISMEYDDMVDRGAVIDNPIQFPSSALKLGGYCLWWDNDHCKYGKCPDCQVERSINFLQMNGWEDDHFPGWMDVAHVTLCPQCGRPGIQLIPSP